LKKKSVGQHKVQNRQGKENADKTLTSVKKKKENLAKRRCKPAWQNTTQDAGCARKSTCRRRTWYRGECFGRERKKKIAGGG